MKDFLSLFSKNPIHSRDSFLFSHLARRLALVLSLFSVLLLWPNEGWPQQEYDYSLEGDMVYIPPGPFVFGTNKRDESAEALSLGIPKPWYADETPRQKFFLKGFYIDRYEVTYKRYKKYVDALDAITSPKQGPEQTVFRQVAAQCGDNDERKPQTHRIEEQQVHSLQNGFI